MNFFKNVIFISRITSKNICQYFHKRKEVHNEPLLKNSIHWFGHATSIINIHDKLVITDPVFEIQLGHFKRLYDTPFDATKLKFDYILLTHGHMDHLSFSSLRKLNKDATIIVPKGYGKLMNIFGFKKVIVIRHGEIYEDDHIKITSLEAIHDGRRFYLGLDDESHAFLIERKDKKIFYAGDTAYTDKFKNINCDIALMPVGCYKPERFSYMHCSPIESYKMFDMMNCKSMIPIHYKTFIFSLDTAEETLKTLNSINDNRIKIIDIGQTFKF